MLGFSYGEILLLLGATAALIGPKDLPRIARTVGRLTGRSIAYVRLARGQFDSVVQQSQASQVHKEVQDAMAQFAVIKHELQLFKSLSPMSGSLTPPPLVENIDKISSEKIIGASERNDKDNKSIPTTSQDQGLKKSVSSDLHSQATAYERLAESNPALNSGSMNSEVLSGLVDESGHVIVLPVSAESAKLLPKRKDDINGSDIVLEALLEAEVARNAKDFFSQPQNLNV